jgi:aryl-alcohol dehydrogenase-like predicted oxidoreductase
MIYRNLGRSGLQISALSFGAWVTFGKQIGDPVAKKLLHTAYDAGINFFDNAEVYAAGQAEIVMGAILKKSGWRRSSYLVSSKAYFGCEDEKPNQTGLSRKHLFEACHAALLRLQVDYLDLYYCHRPDATTPILETCRAMRDLTLIVTRGHVQAHERCERVAMRARERCVDLVVGGAEERGDRVGVEGGIEARAGMARGGGRGGHGGQPTRPGGQPSSWRG